MQTPASLPALPRCFLLQVAIDRFQRDKSDPSVIVFSEIKRCQLLHSTQIFQKAKIDLGKAEDQPNVEDPRAFSQPIRTVEIVPIWRVRGDVQLVDQRDDPRRNSKDSSKAKRCRECLKFLKDLCANILVQHH
jgi:hypothetical protein